MHMETDKTKKTETAINKYSQMVYGIVLTRLCSKSDADDVYQEVFLTYHEKAAEFSSDDHEKAWLIQTAVNICKRYDFSPWRKHTVSLEEAKAQLPYFDTEEQRTVFASLCTLKPKYRMPLYMYYFEGMPTAYIAELLGISGDSVR